MQNPSLLRFLAAVQDHADTSKTLMTAAGYDALELQLAVAIALDEGFVEPSGKIHPSLSLTAAGRAWAIAELAPFTSLMAVADLSGRVA